MKINLIYSNKNLKINGQPLIELVLNCYFASQSIRSIEIDFFIVYLNIF